MFCSTQTEVDYPVEVEVDYPVDDTKEEYQYKPSPPRLVYHIGAKVILAILHKTCRLSQPKAMTYRLYQSVK